jgi:hypothetical protein
VATTQLLADQFLQPTPVPQTDVEGVELEAA